MVQQLMVVFNLLVKSGQVWVMENVLGIIFDIDVSVLFELGQVMLDEKVIVVFVNVGCIFVGSDFFIMVEGYIDNMLISNQLFFFNWEFLVVWVLSVVCLFIENGVEVCLLIVMGYVDQCLVVDNFMLVGCQCNWCVVIIIELQVFDEGVVVFF